MKKLVFLLCFVSALFILLFVSQIKENNFRIVKENKIKENVSWKFYEDLKQQNNEAVKQQDYQEYDYGIVTKEGAVVKAIYVTRGKEVVQISPEEYRQLMEENKRRLAGTGFEEISKKIASEKKKERYIHNWYKYTEDSEHDYLNNWE